jgi:D-glycero-D-manno-heptose 1,7-bisphosphate phosphatase
MTRKRAVFLDRDGVLNYCELKDGKPYPPKDSDSLTIVEDAPELLRKLKEEGFLLICATNQPDFKRGSRTLQNINDMNDKVRSSLPLDDLLVCLHDNDDNCDCRKPKPGMLLKASEKYDIDLSLSYMVGDRAGDVGAGRNAGARTIFLDFGYNEKKPDPPADLTCHSLKEAVETILNEKGKP